MGWEVRRRRGRLDDQDSLVHVTIVSRPACGRANEAETAALAPSVGYCLLGRDRGREQRE